MAQNIEEFRNSIPVGDLGIIPLQSCSELGNMVNEYIVDWNVKVFFIRMIRLRIPIL